jgi:hypothetical protein
MLSTSHILLVTLTLAATTRAGWITGNALTPRQSPVPGQTFNCACPETLNGQTLERAETHFDYYFPVVQCFYIVDGTEVECGYYLGLSVGA